MSMSHSLTFTARVYISSASPSCVEMIHTPSVTPMVAPHNGRVISVHRWWRVRVLVSPFHVVRRPLARLLATAGLAVLGALALMFVGSPNVAHAAQACGTLSSGQVYCLTKTDAV